MLTGLTIWLLLSSAFLFGFLFRGLIARTEAEELDALRAHHPRCEAETALLNRMAER